MPERSPGEQQLFDQLTTLSRYRVLVVAATVALATAPAVARAQDPVAEYPGLETGKMWTFDVPPLEYWARRYGFRPTSDWLDRARLAALRQPGCTASFVSGDGLIMTNHHCARACIEAVSRRGEDLLEQGFYARQRADERPCPNLWVDQLLSISDVTDSIHAAIAAAPGAAAAALARDATMRRLEQRCTAGAPDLVCQAVPLYRGGQYKLHRFRRFRDVRLVMAPEGQIAFFGGDPDNFNWPRHALDVAFYRAWAGDEPVHTEYFRTGRSAPREGDLAFVVGNPGSTGRLSTVAQLEYLRDVQYPAQLAQIGRQLAAYQDVARRDSVRGAALRNTTFGLENTRKAIGGYLAGLRDTLLLTRKRDWETALRAAVNRDAALRRQYGTAWDAIAATRRQLGALDARRRHHSFSAYGAQLLTLAGLIVRSPAEQARPDAERLPAYREAARRSFDRWIDSSVVDTLVEVRLLTAWFTALEADLPPTDPVRRAALAGRTPEAAARAMVGATQLIQPAARRALLAGGPARIAAATDPFLALARVIDPLERLLGQRYAEALAAEARDDERVARALLAVHGTAIAPDATFSLRISDGEIRRYPSNGTFAPPFTTFGGLFDRHDGFAGRAPWHLPRRWLERRDSLPLATPLNAVSTNDIIGGNSGSPVLNRDGELIGLIFDNNVEGLPARFLFTEARGRSIWVDMRAILEALRRVYDAAPLAAELAGAR